MHRVVFLMGLLATLVRSSVLPAADVRVKLSQVRSSDKGIDAQKTAVYGVSVAADGKHVLVGGDAASAIMTLWNMETGEQDQFFDIFEFQQDGSPFTPALSPDGKCAAVSTTLGKLFVFDLASSNLLKKIELPAFAPSIAYAPDSKRIALMDVEGQLTIVNGQDGKEPFSVVSRTRAHEGAGIAVIWSKDGRRLITSSGDKTARIWDAATYKELLKIPHEEWVWSVACSPDSKMLATGTGGELEQPIAAQHYKQGKENNIRLWNIESGKLVREFSGHSHLVRALTFTPDGKRLISGSFDHTLRVWDVATGRELAQVEGQAWVSCVGAAPDSKTIIAGGGSRLIRGQNWEIFPQERLRVFRIEE